MTAFFKRHGWRYFPGVIFLFASAYLQNIAPGLLGRIVDELGMPSVDTRSVYILLGQMLIAAASVFVTRYIWRYFINGNARNMEASLRDQLFTHLQKLGTEFYNRSKTGDLMAYAVNDVNAIRMTFGPAMAMGLNAIVIVAVAVRNMAAEVDLRLALLVLIPAPIIMAVMLIMGREVRVRFKRVQEAFASISDRVQENISGLRVIKAYVQESAEVNRFEELNKNSRDVNLKMVAVSASMSPAVDLFFGVSFTVSLIYGSSLVRQGSITLGDFVAFNGYLTLIVQPVRSIARIVNIISRGLASLKRFNGILSEPPTVTDEPDKAPAGINQAHLQVKNLSFKYPTTSSEDNRLALDGISLNLKPGKTLGITGRTGSGKTTLVNLLVRLYNVPDGTIFFGGTDANLMSLSRLRKPIGYVPQDNFLFSSGVEENIKFFNPIYSHEEVEEAARVSAVLQNILDFPAGFETQVGERGMSLSGGQKQRICIARAMIKKPSLLILDDSLSAVDTVTEAEILTSIKKQTERGGSAIIVGHRVSALAGCDEIILLDHGRIVERGSHEELIALDGLYAATARDQLMEQEEEGTSL